MKVSSKVGSFTYSAIHEMTRLALEHDAIYLASCPVPAGATYHTSTSSPSGDGVVANDPNVLDCFRSQSEVIDAVGRDFLPPGVVLWYAERGELGFWRSYRPVQHDVASQIRRRRERQVGDRTPVRGEDRVGTR